MDLYLYLKYLCSATRSMEKPSGSLLASTCTILNSDRPRWLLELVLKWYHPYVGNNLAIPSSVGTITAGCPYYRLWVQAWLMLPRFFSLWQFFLFFWPANGCFPCHLILPSAPLIGFTVYTGEFFSYARPLFTSKTPCSFQIHFRLASEVSVQ